MALQDRRNKNMEETSKKLKKKVDSLISSIPPGQEASVLSYIAESGLGGEMRELILKRTDIQSEDLQETLQYLTAFLNSFQDDQRQELLEALSMYGLDTIMAEYATQLLNNKLDNLVGGRWDTGFIRVEYMPVLESEGVSFKKIDGKGDLQRTIGYVVESAEKYVWINCGDADFIRPSTKAIVKGMRTGPQWSADYAALMDAGIETRFIANIKWSNRAAWTALEETGVDIRHDSNEVRAGVADGNQMWAFDRGEAEEDSGYIRIDGFPQAQTDKMFYVGFLTSHAHMIKMYEKDFLKMWDNAVPLEKRKEQIRPPIRNYEDE